MKKINLHFLLPLFFLSLVICGCSNKTNLSITKNDIASKYITMKNNPEQGAESMLVTSNTQDYMVTFAREKNTNLLYILDFDKMKDAKYPEDIYEVTKSNYGLKCNLPQEFNNGWTINKSNCIGKTTNSTYTRLIDEINSLKQ